MFIQVIEGRTSDRAGFERQMERWRDELRPGAVGFLGSTAGVTDDGHVVVMARFESTQAAESNSQRPEQGDWWTETEKYFDGEVSFTDSVDVDMLLDGGSNEAGFVQIMKGRADDRSRLREFDDLFAEHAPTFRPDVLGGIRAWTGPSTYTQAVYFRSEAAARAAEADGPPEDLAARMAEFEEEMEGVEFLDLRQPVLF